MKIFWFGTHLDSHEEWMQESSWQNLAALKKELARTETSIIVDVLDSFAGFWKDPKIIQALLPELMRESGFSESEVESTLKLLPSLLSKESLQKRLKEFPSGVLDKFTKTPGFEGRVKAIPMGTLLHVTAGNVFLGSIDSLIMGLLTKNISLLKVSSQNTFFPMYFAQALKAHDQKNILSNKFSVLHWKGGDKKIEKFLKSKVDAIIAWGGEEMINSYREDLPPTVKFLDFGPKVSLQVISQAGLDHQDLSKVAQSIVQDIVPWDQGACASPQNLYLQEGIDVEGLWKALDQAFVDARPRGEISPDEATEIQKEKYRALYSELMEKGKARSGKEYLLHLEQNKYLRPGPLNRTLIVKTFTDVDDLVRHLEPFSYYLQSCSYLLHETEKESYLNELALCGLKRFAPIGTITFGKEGAPHDGRFVLRELVRFVGDEIRIQDLTSDERQLQTSQDVKKVFESSPHRPGYIFSSGGTTGEPKFVRFSYEEFDFVTDMLVYNFQAQGITPGMTVANLFVAGNLWSSFMAVEKALEKLGAIQLPIGGMCTQENISLYLRKFKPQVVMGIPSMLVSLAEYLEARGESISVQSIFYAGEALSAPREVYLRSQWGCEKIGSAGYASVDAGVIGYQCSSCNPGEHHLFSDLVDMKIIDDEAVVTSLYRDTLPIHNYRTGDRVAWIEDCASGRPDRRFKLLGRIDNMIQIWSCRLNVQDIEGALQLIDPDIKTFQIILRSSAQREIFELYYEKGSKNITDQELISAIYQASRDVRDTLSLEQFGLCMRVIGLETGMIPRNARTGKISTVVDKR